MSESFTIKESFQVSAETLYNAWLDGDKHSNMTGGGIAQVEPHEGGQHAAWNGYIRGKNIRLEPYRRIVQSWRSAEFPEGSEDSLLEVIFDEEGGKTTVTINHSNIPEGQSEQYKEGWQKFYFTPMKAYFEK